MISTADLKRYLKDRHALRQEQIILPNGIRYGEVEEEWQLKHVWEPLDAMSGTGHRKHHVVYLELARGHAKTSMGAMEALTAGLLEDRLEVHFFAGDAEQAGIALTILAGMIRSNPDLARSFSVDNR